ncbi:MAG: purine-nucleoside phosphorylase [Bacteriovoracaceae bacterium]|nr:purine-nucleoside phosphorylase [Bacteriovoracaceae bacterium]
MFEKLKLAAQKIAQVCDTPPTVGILLGSGLGSFIDRIEDKQIIPYSEIPYFPNTDVEGVPGRLILGKLGNKRIAVLHGRHHCYDGIPMDEVVFPIRALATLGIDSMILTSASGGVNLGFKPGDLMLIEDHINLMGTNPLVGGPARELGPKFPNMLEAYNIELSMKAKEVADEMDIKLQQGIFVGVLGPTYETPAEVRMIRTMGGDVVGMSTVPESIAANHLGLKVLGITIVTNMAAGISTECESSEENKHRALKIVEILGNLLCKTIERI